MLFRSTQVQAQVNGKLFDLGAGPAQRPAFQLARCGETMVQAGMGLAVLSEHALNAGSATADLCTLAVQSFPIHANWYTVRPNGKRPSPVAADFWRYLNVDLKKQGARA